MANQKPLMAAARKADGPDEELVELCRMMRLMSDRDTDATLPQVLKAMLLEARGKPVGGSELSKSSGINRITIIHHLRRLEDAGFVRRMDGKYVLRVQTAEEMLLEFRKEMEQAFSEMYELAREIDSQFADFERQPLQARERRRRFP